MEPKPMRKPKKIKKLFLILIIIAVFSILTYILNETPLIYFPSTQYQQVDESKISSLDFAPFRIDREGSDTIIMFIHGYKSTPMAFKEIAGHFSSRYNVIVPIHPGHGTFKEDFKKTFYPQWYQHTRDVYLQERRKFKKIYLCGHSMGGLIALRIIQDFSKSTNLSPDAAITISAPVFLNDLTGSGVLHDWRLYFIRYTSWLLGEIRSNPNPADVDGAPVCEPADYTNYNFPPQVYSLKMGMYTARQNLSSIRIPMLLMHARGDKTAPYENLFYIADRISSNLIRVRTFDLTRWDHNRHSINVYRSTQAKVIAEIENFLNDLNNKTKKKTPATTDR